MIVTFEGGKLYGVDDLNDITARLVGAGVAPIEAKDSYSYDDLNALTAAVASQGVSAQGLKVGFEENTITIGRGIAYFENGVTVSFEEAEAFPCALSEAYVYLKYSKSLHVASVEISENDFDAEDKNNYFIPLARLEGETVYDRRIFAQSKIATFGANLVTEFHTAMTIPETRPQSLPAGELLFSVPIAPNYSRIFFKSYTSLSSGEKTEVTAILRLSDMMWEVVCKDGEKATTESDYAYLPIFIKAELAGDKVNFLLYGDISKSSIWSFDYYSYSGVLL